MIVDSQTGEKPDRFAEFFFRKPGNSVSTVNPHPDEQSVAVHQGTQEQERTKAPVETEVFRSDVVFWESSASPIRTLCESSPGRLHHPPQMQS